MRTRLGGSRGRGGGLRRSGGLRSGGGQRDGQQRTAKDQSGGGIHGNLGKGASQKAKEALRLGRNASSINCSADSTRRNRGSRRSLGPSRCRPAPRRSSNGPTAALDAARG